MRLVEIGATRYRRISRNLGSLSYSAAKPNPPCVWRQTLAASHAAFAASCLAMFASAPQGSPPSKRSHALKRIRLAASTSNKGFSDRKGDALVLADRAAEHNTLAGILGGAADEPVTVADAFGGDQRALGFEAPP